MVLNTVVIYTAGVSVGQYLLLISHELGLPQGFLACLGSLSSCDLSLDNKLGTTSRVGYLSWLLFLMPYFLDNELGLPQGLDTYLGSLSSYLLNIDNELGLPQGLVTCLGSLSSCLLIA